MGILKSITVFTLSSVISLVSLANETSEPAKVNSLEGLLKQVEQFQQQENAINIKREAEFKQNQLAQKQLLKQAKAELKAEQKRADQLKASFDNNEKRLADKEDNNHTPLIR